MTPTGPALLPDHERATAWANAVVSGANAYLETNPIANLARCYLDAMSRARPAMDGNESEECPLCGKTESHSHGM